MSYKAVKRGLDILLSLILIIILSPLLLVISLLISIGDGHSVFVKEPKRIGFKGKEFTMYKFRTMVPNAHQIIRKGPQYEKWIKNEGKLKIAEDERITPIGKILRKTDLDELPQLFNVLKNEMSLVGPRPMYLEEEERYLSKYPYGKKYVKRILRVKPGITGLWQVSGRNSIKFKDRMIMEAKYASHINIVTDIKILIKTPFVVLTRKGVYE